MSDPKKCPVVGRQQPDVTQAGEADTLALVALCECGKQKVPTTRDGVKAHSAICLACGK